MISLSLFLCCVVLCRYSPCEKQITRPGIPAVCRKLFRETKVAEMEIEIQVHNWIVELCKKKLLSFTPLIYQIETMPVFKGNRHLLPEEISKSCPYMSLRILVYNSAFRGSHSPRKPKQYFTERCIPTLWSTNIIEILRSYLQK